MRHIPVKPYFGKKCLITISRGLGGHGHRRINKHRGTVLDATHNLVLIRSIYSDREMWIPRPRFPHDSIEEITEAKK